MSQYSTTPSALCPWSHQGAMRTCQMAWYSLLPIQNCMHSQPLHMLATTVQSCLLQMSSSPCIMFNLCKTSASDRYADYMLVLYAQAMMCRARCRAAKHLGWQNLLKYSDRSLCLYAATYSTTQQLTFHHHPANVLHRHSPQWLMWGAFTWCCRCWRLLREHTNHQVKVCPTTYTMWKYSSHYKHAKSASTLDAMHLSTEREPKQTT